MLKGWSDTVALRLDDRRRDQRARHHRGAPDKADSEALEDDPDDNVENKTAGAAPSTGRSRSSPRHAPGGGRWANDDWQMARRRVVAKIVIPWRGRHPGDTEPTDNSRLSEGQGVVARR